MRRWQRTPRPAAPTGQGLLLAPGTPAPHRPPPSEVSRLSCPGRGRARHRACARAQPRLRSPWGVFPPAVAKETVASLGRRVRNNRAAAAVARKRRAGAQPRAGSKLQTPDARTRRPGRPLLGASLLIPDGCWVPVLTHVPSLPRTELLGRAPPPSLVLSALEFVSGWGPVVTSASLSPASDHPPSVPFLNVETLYHGLSGDPPPWPSVPHPQLLFKS